MEEKAIVEEHGKGRNWRCQISFRGKTRWLTSWAKELGLNRLRLRKVIQAKADITPYLRGDVVPDRRTQAKLWNFHGERLSLKAIAARLGDGMNAAVLRTRLRGGWVPERAFSTPVASYRLKAREVDEALPADLVKLQAKLAKIDALDAQIANLRLERTVLIAEIRKGLRG